MTVQMRDELVWQGVKFPTETEPLSYLPDRAERIPEFAESHTANWRRYLCNWALIEGRLYLTGIKARHASDGREVTLDDLFPQQVMEGRVIASWFTDSIELGAGAAVRDHWAVYGMHYRDRVSLHFEQGVFVRKTQERQQAYARGRPLTYAHATRNHIASPTGIWKPGMRVDFDLHFSDGLRPGTLELRLRQHAPLRSEPALPSLLEPFDKTLVLDANGTALKDLLTFIDALVAGNRRVSCDSGRQHAFESAPDSEATGSIWNWRMRCARSRSGMDATLVWQLECEEAGVWQHYTLVAPVHVICMELYTKLADYLSSPLYDPMGFETLRTEQGLGLLVRDKTSAEIREAMCGMSEEMLERLRVVLMQVALERKDTRSLHVRSWDDYVAAALALEELPRPYTQQELEDMGFEEAEYDWLRMTADPIRFDRGCFRPWRLDWTMGYGTAQAWDVMEQDARRRRLTENFVLDQWPGWKGEPISEAVPMKLGWLAKRVEKASLLWMDELDEDDLE